MEESKKPQVVFAIYDTFYNFLGYKSDSSWDLVAQKERAKSHPAETAERNSELIEGLLFILNGGFRKENKPHETPFNKGNYDLNRTLHVIPEELASSKPLPEIRIIRKRRGNREYCVQETAVRV